MTSITLLLAAICAVLPTLPGKDRAWGRAYIVPEEYYEEPTGRGPLIGNLRVHTFPGIKLDGSVFSRRLAHFSFKGSPITLIIRLSELDARIFFDRSCATGNFHKLDITTRLSVQDFNGTVLELLTTIFPRNYGEPVWTAHVDPEGNTRVSFGGPVEKTPLLPEPESIPFIPPGQILEPKS